MEVEVQSMPQSVKGQCQTRVRSSKAELTKLRAQAVRPSNPWIRCLVSYLSGCVFAMAGHVSAERAPLDHIPC